ncbi:hypothetical protein NL676_030582 [Syzygium grande]|nr:hypothetical protein NL676_030582 [Syzygium grande]
MDKPAWYQPPPPPAQYPPPAGYPPAGYLPPGYGYLPVGYSYAAPLSGASTGWFSAGGIRVSPSRILVRSPTVSGTSTCWLSAAGIRVSPAGYGYAAPPPAYQTSGGKSFILMVVGQILGSGISEALFNGG